MLGRQRQPQIVLTDVDQVGKPFHKPEDNQHIGKRAYGDPKITLFETGDGTRRRSRAHGEIRHGDTTPQTRVSDIATQLLKR